jgi:hypothetical protein
MATAAKARWAALRTSHSGAAAARIATCSAAEAGTRHSAYGEEFYHTDPWAARAT